MDALRAVVAAVITLIVFRRYWWSLRVGHHTASRSSGRWRLTLSNTPETQTFEAPGPKKRRSCDELRVQLKALKEVTTLQVAAEEALEQKDLAVELPQWREQALAFQAATKSAQRRCFQLEEEARHWQMQVKEQARLLQIAESMVDHAAAGRREAEAAKFHSDLEVLQRKLDTTKRALDFKVNEEAARAELREFDIVERQMRAADEWAEVVATRGGRAVSERGALEDHHEEEVMEHSSAANTAASSRATAPTSRLSGATAGTPSRSGKASGLPLPSTRTKLTGATPPRRIPAASSSPSTTPRHATSSSSPTTPRRIAPTASSPSKANGTRANSSPLDNAMVPYIAEQGEKAIRKVGDGLYSIRNKHHTVVLRNEHLLLRVGGGFMTLDEYLTRRAV